MAGGGGEGGGGKAGEALARLLHTDSIGKVSRWDCKAKGGGALGPEEEVKMICGFRGHTPSYEALKGALADLYRMDDFDMEKLGMGFFSEVFKVTHRVTGKVMVLKMNKHRSNRTNMLKEIQLMNKLKHPNILRYEAVCVHEGQLHALTEYIEGGTLEELCQDHEQEVSWAQRMEIGLHIARGVQYLNNQGMFHRDLTSKNVFIRKEPSPNSGSPTKLTAIVGDFGLAAEIPARAAGRLPQVGSPYWMSPECLRGEYYDHTADIFSLGIILCEMIARVDADPDTLPRTQNFGVEYKAFSALCPECPPDFLKLAFSCVSISPSSRPSVGQLITELRKMASAQRLVEECERKERANTTMSARRVALKRLSEGGDPPVPMRATPSDRARLHTRPFSAPVSASQVGEEWCRLDPYYTEPLQKEGSSVNPFATLPRLREGRKIIGSTFELFSSCFEVPSPRVTSPTSCPPSPGTRHSTSLPNSPPSPRASVVLPTNSTSSSTPKGRQKGKGRIVTSSSGGMLLEREEGRDRRGLQPYRGCLSQDDSFLGCSSGLLAPFTPSLRRFGSCESGIFSVSTTVSDWLPGALSSRSLASSLLTVSDLEEDLRAASAFLSTKRSSSVFTDSLDDLSSRLDDISGLGGVLEERRPEKYEKDIRDIVEYFERKKEKKISASGDEVDTRTSPEIARSQKIESLIKKVAENKNRARFDRRRPAAHQLQVCDGIVRSKLPLFDQAKRQGRGRLPYNQGFVKARLAMFDKPTPKPSRKLVSDFLIRQRELRTFKPSKTAEKEKTRGENTDSAKALPRTPELKLHKALP